MAFLATDGPECGVGTETALVEQRSNTSAWWKLDMLLKQ
jgi:hypothetical protein